MRTILVACFTLCMTAVQGDVPSTVPSEFAGSPAVVLEDRHSWTVHVTRGTHSRSQRLRIQSRAGLEYSDQFFYYEASNGRLERFSARTVQPDGSSWCPESRSTHIPG